MRKYLSLLCFVLLCGCDCVTNVEGLILDSETKSPIANVMISTINLPASSGDRDQLYSSISGNFNYHRMGGIRGCGEVALYFYKTGYEASRQICISRSENDTIYMVKRR